LTRYLIALLLCATAAGVWAHQPRGGSAAEVRTFDVVSSRFTFDPMVISVNEGDTVRLRLRSTDRTHSLALEVYKVKVLIPKGRESVVEFVADRPGHFAFTCDEYCGAGHSAMRGTLIVSRARE
jgi:cytochrome c oxidase subunit II